MLQNGTWSEEIKSAASIPTGVKKLERETEALKRQVESYAQRGLPIPVLLQKQLVSLTSNTEALQRYKAK